MTTPRIQTDMATGYCKHHSRRRALHQNPRMTVTNEEMRNVYKHALPMTANPMTLGSFHHHQMQSDGGHGGSRFAARPKNSFTTIGWHLYAMYGIFSSGEASSCVSTITCGAFAADNMQRSTHHKICCANAGMEQAKGSVLGSVLCGRRRALLLSVVDACKMLCNCWIKKLLLNSPQNHKIRLTATPLQTRRFKGCRRRALRVPRRRRALHSINKIIRYAILC